MERKRHGKTKSESVKWPVAWLTERNENRRIEGKEEEKEKFLGTASELIELLESIHQFTIAFYYCFQNSWLVKNFHGTSIDDKNEYFEEILSKPFRELVFEEFEVVEEHFDDKFH